MNKALVGIAVAAAVLAGVMMLRDSTDASKPMAGEPKARAVPGKTSSEVVLSISPGVGRDGKAATPGKISPLRNEVRTARDFKPIYERLKVLPNPSPEETYYLAYILESCARDKDLPGPPRTFKVDEAKARFAASLSPRAPDREKRLAAFDRAMQTGCEGFGDVLTTRKEIRDLLERAAAAGEPKAQARLLSYELQGPRLDAPGAPPAKPDPITDEQIARMKSIVASGDPGVLVDVTLMLMFRNEDMHLRDPDEAPIDNQLLHQAALLAACELGYPCDANSRRMAHACAFSGYCDAADYRDYVLFYELSPGTAQRAMLYQAQLLRAVREGDWSYFTFQRGPAPANAVFQ